MVDGQAAVARQGGAARVTIGLSSGVKSAPGLVVTRIADRVRWEAELEAEFNNAQQEP